MTKMADKSEVDDDGRCPATKRVKLNDEKLADDASEEKASFSANGKSTDGDDGDDGGGEIELNLSTFEVTRVLQNNCARKLICLEGRFEDREGPAVVLLEQKSFPYDESTLKKSFFDEKTVFQKYFMNDIYRNYDCFPTGQCISIFVNHL